MRMNSIWVIGAITLIGLTSATPGLGDDRDTRQSGDINIEDSGPAKNTYSDTQSETIEYFKKFAEITTQLAQGASTGTIPAPGDNMLTYLNAVYLYYAVNYGEFAPILDGILEIDIVNSRIAKQAACPSMTRFWKSWVRSDMEARQKYLVHTAHLKATSDFNQNKRGAYIKCQEAVAHEIEDRAADQAYFKQRYASDSSHALTAARVVRLLEDIKVRVPNVFAAVGTSFGAAKATSASDGKKLKR